MNVICKDRWLIVSFDEPQMALSWAIYGGGRKETQCVAWHQVTYEDLKPPVDPKEYLEMQLEKNSMLHAVGMLTSADLDAHTFIEKNSEKITACCIATVGMTNALRIGDPVENACAIGTINLLCSVSVPLSEEAQLEALSLAVEARTAAVLQAEIPSIQSGFAATGTGTDCVVITSEISNHHEVLNYAGKHTQVGSLVGQCVFEAVSRGLENWKNKTKGAVSI
jgi:adenosylcobinamide amidohydrolase